MVVPRLDPAEPLGLELADFAQAIETGTRPRSHAALGVEVVRILEAAHASLAASGRPVAVDATRRDYALVDGARTGRSGAAAA